MRSEGNAMIITVAQEKGGVGKTATAKNLAVAAARQGRRVLAVDADPQWALTRQLGLHPGTPELPFTLVDVLTGRLAAGEAIVSGIHGIDVLPAARDLRGVELALVGEVARDTRLVQALAPIQDSYELIVIDTPPNLGMLTVNALVPADVVLAPVAASDEGAVQGLAELRATLAKLAPLRADQGAPELQVVLTRWRDGRRMTAAVEDALATLGVPVTVRVPHRAVVQHASVRRVPVVLSNPDSPPAVAYDQLARALAANGAAR